MVSPGRQGRDAKTCRTTMNAKNGWAELAVLAELVPVGAGREGVGLGDQVERSCGVRRVSGLGGYATDGRSVRGLFLPSNCTETVSADRNGLAAAVLVFYASGSRSNRLRSTLILANNLSISA